MPSPGYAEFAIGGKAVRLDGVLEDPHAEELFFILRDQTSGKETYPAGRFLYADLPKSGKVVLDFNKSYNPPCAFTAYATCPLPPPAELDAGPHRSGRAGLRQGPLEPDRPVTPSPGTATERSRSASSPDESARRP